MRQYIESISQIYTFDRTETSSISLFCSFLFLICRDEWLTTGCSSDLGSFGSYTLQGDTVCAISAAVSRASERDIVEELKSERDAFCTPVVSVFVGPDLKEYRIHYGVLVHSSFWFKREFSEEWSETEYPRVYLRDETNEIFDVAMNWLYARRLENDGGDLSRRHHYSMSLQKMCEVYRFAEKYIIPGLANTVIGYFIGQFASDWAIPTRTIMYAIKNFSSDSLLWKLISTLLEKAFGLRGWDKFAGTCDERWLKDIERWANDSPRPSQGTRSFDKTACRSMNRDEYFYHSILEIPGATVAYKRPYSMTRKFYSLNYPYN